MWGTLERYYFLKHWYEDCKGVVEYLGDYARLHTTTGDVKKLGYVCAVIIIMLVALKAGEFLKHPRKKS